MYDGDWFDDENYDLEFEEYEVEEKILLNDFCCPKCEEQNVLMNIWRDEKLDVIEYNFECLSCDHRWHIINATQT